MPEVSKQQFEYIAFWNEWMDIKRIFEREGSLSSSERSSLAYVEVWARGEGLAIHEDILEILERTKKTVTTDGVTLTEVDGSQAWAIKDYVNACVEQAPYSMSDAEAQRFVSIYNDANPRQRITWNEGLTPTIAPNRFAISKIEAIDSPDLKAQFDQYVQNTTGNPLQEMNFIAPTERARMSVALGAAGSHFLFHGTSVAGVKGIGKHGFDPFRCNVSKSRVLPDRYGSLGQGAYLSDNFSKCAAYSRCSLCNSVACACAEGERPVLLSLVRYTDKDRIKTDKTYGRRFRTVAELLKKMESGAATTMAHGTPDRSKWQKTFDTRFGNNDFLVYRNDMALPAYVIWYKRT
ncbi:MAG: hypothetical protein OXU20_11495 [Myxococcales bacterium]|nr:hypothetical protein [Myxococcales bacterium]MDD9968596.1 hypothetical protein [Myxococcales bacterium]